MSKDLCFAPGHLPHFYALGIQTWLFAVCDCGIS